MAKRTIKPVGTDRGSIVPGTLSPMNSQPQKGDSYPENNGYCGKKSLSQPKDPLGYISAIERKGKS